MIGIGETHRARHLAASDRVHDTRDVRGRACLEPPRRLGEARPLGPFWAVWQRGGQCCQGLEAEPVCGRAQMEGERQFAQGRRACMEHMAVGMIQGGRQPWRRILTWGRRVVSVVGVAVVLVGVMAHMPKAGCLFVLAIRRGCNPDGLQR